MDIVEKLDLKLYGNAVQACGQYVNCYGNVNGKQMTAMLAAVYNKGVTDALARVHDALNGTGVLLRKVEGRE